jgi:hypothetical protein
MGLANQMSLPRTRGLDRDTARRASQRAAVRAAVRGIRVVDARLLALRLEQRTDVRHFTLLFLFFFVSFFGCDRSVLG